jgi:hypothetical protein
LKLKSSKVKKDDLGLKPFIKLNPNRLSNNNSSVIMKIGQFLHRRIASYMVAKESAKKGTAKNLN